MNTNEAYDLSYQQICELQAIADDDQEWPSPDTLKNALDTLDEINFSALVDREADDMARRGYHLPRFSEIPEDTLRRLLRAAIMDAPYAMHFHRDVFLAESVVEDSTDRFTLFCGSLFAAEIMYELLAEKNKLTGDKGMPEFDAVLSAYFRLFKDAWFAASLEDIKL